MSIRLLRTLVAVADTKTFSAAADVVHVTHAAVSQQMQNLEADLGLTLFDRSKRTPELTPVALQVVERARRILADYENLVPAVLADDGLSGQVRFGTLRTTLTGLTPQAMAVLKRRFPQIGLNIRPDLTNVLLAEIERGALDAAVITKPHLLPAGIEFRDLTEEKMHLIAAIEDPCDDPFELLRTRPFIRFNRNAVVGTLIENWIRSKHLRVDETMELDSPEAISSMVQSNLGVSIVPRLAVRPPNSVPVKRLCLGEDAPVRTLGLAYRTDQIKTQLMEELYRALAEVIAEART